MLNIPFIPSPLSTLVQLKKLHCAAVCACFTSLEHFILYTTIVHYHQVKPPSNLLLLIPTTGWCYFRSSSSLKCTKMAPRLFSSLLLFLSRFPSLTITITVLASVIKTGLSTSSQIHPLVPCHVAPIAGLVVLR